MFIRSRKNAVTLCPADSAPSVNAWINAEVLPFFRGLPFKMMIFLLMDICTAEYQKNLLKKERLVGSQVPLDFPVGNRLGEIIPLQVCQTLNLGNHMLT